MSNGDTTRTPTGPRPSDLGIAREFADALAEHRDPSGFTVTLFGSRARGDASEESDVDLFVALSSDDPRGETKRIARRIAADLTLEHGVLVSVRVADRAFMERHRGYGLLEAVQREGIRV